MSTSRKVTQIIIVFFALAVSGCTASRQSGISRKLSKVFFQSKLLQKNFTGLVIYNPVSDKTLFTYQADHFFTPASNTKLMTFYTGLQALGDSIPGMEYCISGDTLYFSGTGDPTFLNPAFDSQPVYDMLNSSPHTLAYFSNIFEDKRFGPGWSWDDYPYYFSPEKAPFPIYGNVVEIKSSEGGNSYKIIPDFFINHTRIVQDSLVEKTKLTRLENENVFGIAYPVQNERIDDEIPFKYSEKLMLQLLQDTLKRNIIYIKKKPNCETKIFHSQPADSVFRRMLLVSDNFIAEQILLMGAYNLFDTLNSNKMIDFSRENWLPELDNGSRWKDGSGLSRYNQFSPNDMLVVLSKLFRTISTQRLFELMPHGNELKFPGNEDDDAYLIAKTGSMSYVYNLSGFMKTRSGKILIFSFMNNNFTISNDIIQREMARVLEAFRRKN